MKRSEFEKVINSVATEELARLSGKIKELSEPDALDWKAFIADMYVEGIVASARTTADIIEKLGLIDLSDG